MRKILLLVLALAFLTFPKLIFAKDILTTGKLITVDIGKQMLYAWDGGQIKFQTPVSSGLWQSPTPKGSFKILSKYGVSDMRGVSPVYGKYWLKNVPNIMYFYQGGYAIHGAYWHNRFGSRASNGCVNVPLEASKWLFDWAEVGTQIEIF